MPNVVAPTALVVLVSSWFAAACCAQPESAGTDFSRSIQPMIESACLHCHNADDAQGDLRLDSRAAALKGGGNGPAIVVGKPGESPFYSLVILPDGHDEVMPPDGPPLDKSQAERIKSWIANGAPWPTDVKLTIKPRIEFAKHVQPVLEENCLSCHRTDKAEGDLDLSTRSLAFSTGASSPVIVPYDAEESPLYALTVTDRDADELMPPSNSGGPLKKELTERLRLWIAQGALWPDGISLVPKAKNVDRTDSPDNLELVKRIHKLVGETSKENSEADMTDYAAKVPRSGADFQMVAIRGGQFLMGSPATEANRLAAEGPPVAVTVDPFWIGRYEVTWDEYEPFMITQVDRKKHGARVDFDASKHEMVDAVSQPTKPYMEMSFGMGQRGYPAISMTQHAANKYCQWLSAQTGHFYRLPTEAEWEYACRAGTTTAYSFGDASKIGQYAWYYENSNEKYQKVGKKKPNAWGLHDMHGNVMEWTADRFSPTYFQEITEQPKSPFLKPRRLYPRTVRGGSWDDDPENLRTAFRKGSAAIWKQQDPQLPKSIWYHTDAQWLGFRIVRPLAVPSADAMYFYWNSATGARK